MAEVFSVKLLDTVASLHSKLDTTVANTKDIQSKLSSYLPVVFPPHPPDESLARLDNLAGQVGSLRGDVESLKRDLAEIKSALAQLVVVG